MNENGKEKQKKQNATMKKVPPEPTEKRTAQRLNEEHEVIITIVSDGKNLPDEKLTMERSKDISATGAKIKGKIPLPVDTLLNMELTLKALQQNIKTLGKVKWLKVIIEDESYEAGIEFVDTPEEAMKKIEDYISLKQKYNTLNPVAVPFRVFARFNRPK